MTSVNFTVLDIGHGNCTIIDSENSITIIDAAQGSDLVNILLAKGVSEIDDLILSHSDSDHIGGAISLLMDDNIVVKRIHINSDPIKDTQKWQSIIIAVRHARVNQGTKLRPSIARDQPPIEYPDYTLEILAPDPADCLTGPGSTSTEGRRLDANTMSVVLRLVHESENIALIPGDMDANSLEFLKSEQQCLQSKILIFPHHGGLPGTGNAYDFAKELCELVNPELILFSNSRNRHNNPIPDVIAGARASHCGAHLACTQISQTCCSNEDSLSNDHLITMYPSKGRAQRYSCAGSVSISLNGRNTDVQTPLDAHKAYILGFGDRKCI
ncbi:ComEC/Rec2 family competence protein [Vibrio furnissii]|uniref:ComEC/Rec2 family competence protein n=1 Tax=Vibrio furnissii TaxID=29494 RepID=UPI002572C852|nr:MBL fold metallo-hydrolase [Vibrio furnissii]WJG23456.1 MBL fold metallo-hydrolase [Vibrio furnissii]